MNEIPLPAAFVRKGWTYRLIDRDGDVALLEKTKPNVTNPSYEAVVVQHKPAWTVAGNEIPAKEAVPSDAQWGSQGWSYNDLVDARRKMRALVDKAGQE